MRNRLVAFLPIVAVAGSVLTAQNAPPPPAPAATAQTPVPPGQPTEPPPVTFRVQVNYVEVDALVTDAQGNPVRNLSREDFEVLEDGVAQKVELFTYFDVPVVGADKPLFSSTAIEPDVRSNAPADGRLYVIVLDDLHTYSLRSTLVKKAAHQFIEQHMGANDLAAIVHLSGRTDVSQDLTSNKRLLLAAVDRFMGQKLTSPTVSRLDAYNRTMRDSGTSSNQQRIDDPDEAQRAYNARTSLESIESIGKFLESIRGRRKALLWFSEGIDYDIYDVFSNRSASMVLDNVRDAIGAATRGNVSIYGIDPRGLTTLGDETIEIGSFPDDRSTGITSSAMLSDLQLSQDSLRILSDETGGFAAVNSNDFKAAFDRIVRENSSYYVLGYYPTNEKRDGRFRKIEVRMKKPGLQVRARKGYVAPRGRPPEPPKTDVTTGTSQELRDALQSPISEGSFGLQVNATSFKGEAPKASVLVTVQVEGNHFKFTEKGGTFLDKLELSYMAVDPKGKIQAGDRQLASLNLRPQTRQLVEVAGFRSHSRMSLAPGRYQLRVGVRAESTGAVGTVVYDLEVPDFSKEQFSISGLLVGSTLAGITPTGQPDEQLKDVLKAPPTTARDFVVADTLWAFAEIYDNQVSTPHQVDIRTMLRAEDGRVVFKTEDQRSTDELQGAKGGFGHLGEVPLKDIAPGRYLLRVEAQSRLSGSQPVARETLVRVWPMPQRQQEPSASNAAPPKVLIDVARGALSGVSTFKTTVARNEGEVQALWAESRVRTPPPRVSFENTMVVAVFLGSRPSAGYGVEIAGVKRDGEALVVEFVERSPAEGTASADVITTPFAIAGVPMHAGEVRFEKVESAR